MQHDCPLGGEWTADELDGFPVDGRRRELLDGVLLVYPPPASAHQVIAMRLMVALEESCPSHLQATPAVDVRLGTRLVFRPDVLVCTEEAARRRSNFCTADEVVLAVEVVSATSCSMDEVLKPALYAQAGIPFYWRVDTGDDIVVHTFTRDPAQQAYVPSGTFTDVVRVDEPWRIEVPVGRLRPRRR